MTTRKRKRARRKVPPVVRCKSCRFCEDIGTHWEGYSVGICHRFPPTCKAQSPDPEGYEQPVVAREGDWCGEHTPNAAGQTPAANRRTT